MSCCNTLRQTRSSTRVPACSGCAGLDARLPGDETATKRAAVRLRRPGPTAGPAVSGGSRPQHRRHGQAAGATTRSLRADLFKIRSGVTALGQLFVFALDTLMQLRHISPLWSASALLPGWRYAT